MKQDKKIKSLKQDIKNYRLLSITYRGISILCILGTAYFIYKEFSPDKKINANNTVGKRIISV